jgi:hypothetical protein
LIEWEGCVFYTFFKNIFWFFMIDNTLRERDIYTSNITSCFWVYVIEFVELVLILWGK